MSDQNRKRKQVTLLSFVKKVREDKKQNIPEVKEDSRSTANDLPQPEKVLDNDVQEKMKVSENIRYPNFFQNNENNIQTPVSNITVTDFDIANYIQIKGPVPNLEVIDILSNIWYPDENYTFPITLIKSKNLRFQMQWFSKWHWLSYSQKLDGAFCKYCVLFSTKEVGAHKNQNTGKLVSEPFKKWNHAVEYFKNHDSLKYHQRCFEIYSNLKKINEKSIISIDKILDKKKAEEVYKNRQILCSIIKTVIFCGKQGIALRGHSDYGPLNLTEETNKNEGNFRALLKFRVEAGDDVLEKHLEESGRNTYISWRTQNEIISSINEIILKDIVNRVNKSECFSIIADETTDIAGIQQLSLAVRFIIGNLIHEEFLQFIPVTICTGTDLASTILKSLESFGINLSFLRGQGYDGASSMSGELQGVNAHLKKKYPLALYVHCSSHSLNLAISDSCNIREIQKCMAIISQIYNFFHTPKRQHCLKSKLEEYCPESKKQKLVGMCKTRWVERHDSVIVLVELFPAVIAALEEISFWKDKDASTHASLIHASLLKSDFLISLLCLSKLFAVTKQLCEYLQSITLDLKKALNYVDSVIESLEDMKINVDCIFKEIYDEAEKLLKDSEGNNAELKMPRFHAGKCSGYRNNVPAANAEEYYRRSIFLPFINNMISQLKVRLQKQNNILGNFSCLMNPTYNEENVNDFFKLAEFYSKGEPLFLEHKDVLLSELKLFKMTLKHDSSPSAFEYYSSCNDEFYPRVKRLLKILCTLPITNCTSERSFSTLRRLKTYLRSTMHNERLNGLALLNSSNVTISPEEVINEIAKKPRKLDFIL